MKVKIKATHIKYILRRYKITCSFKNIIQISLSFIEMSVRSNFKQLVTVVYVLKIFMNLLK